MHFSTAKQLPATLNRFFADAPVVTILKCDYGRLSAWKVVKWEAVEGGESEYRLLEAFTLGFSSRVDLCRRSARICPILTDFRLVLEKQTFLTCMRNSKARTSSPTKTS